MHPRHDELGIALERGGGLGLMLRLEGVVDLFGDAFGQFAGDRHHVDPAGERGDHAGQPLDLAQVGTQRPVGPRVLHLDRHRLPTHQHPTVHLADGRSRGGPQVDRFETLPPAWA